MYNNVLLYDIDVKWIWFLDTKMSHIGFYSMLMTSLQYEYIIELGAILSPLGFIHPDKHKSQIMKHTKLRNVKNQVILEIKFINI